MKQTVDHPNYGAIDILLSSRAKRISISVNAVGRIKLTVPIATPVKDGFRFLETKKEWLDKVLSKVNARKTSSIIIPPVSTRFHTLEAIGSDTKEFRYSITGSKLLLTYPHHLEIGNDRLQSALKEALMEIWRREATTILPKLTESLATAYSFKYGTVKVRNTVSKWGSCSSRNDISLSLHLMKLPDHLIIYVILHELCHTVHHNHGPRFHALLDKVTNGKHLELKKELRQYHTR